MHRKIFGWLLLFCVLIGLGIFPVFAEDEIAHERHVFRVGEVSELTYLSKSMTTGNLNGQCRYADRSDQIVYRYHIRHTAEVQSVTWSACLSQQLLLSVSSDGVVWREVYRWVGTVAPDGQGGMSAEMRTYDLTPYVNLSECSVLYIRIKDSYPEGGWGGAVMRGMDCTLDVAYSSGSVADPDAAEMMVTEHRLPLHGCNTPYSSPSFTFTVDKTDPWTGTGCYSYTFGWLGDEQKYSFTCPMPLETPVDGTGYDTLEFDFYVSDLSLFDMTFTDTGFELTSAGRPDRQEISWKLVALCKGAVGGLQCGWNHVSVPLDTANKVDGSEGPFRQSDINFIRVFLYSSTSNRDSTTPETPITFKIDNICLTDAQKRTQNALLSEISPLLSQMSALSTVKLDSFTHENFTQKKAEVAEVRQLYEALEPEMQARVRPYGEYDSLLQAEYAILLYQKQWDEEEATRLEQERAEEERLEQERIEQERAEKEREEKERAEQERLEKERREQEEQEKQALLLARKQLAAAVPLLVVLAALVVAAVCVYFLIYKKIRSSRM